MDELKAESSSLDLSEAHLHHEGLLRNLFHRELGSRSGREERESVAENRFVDKQDMESTPCKCSSGSTRSAFLTVFSSDSSIMASTHGDHNLYVTRDGVCVRTLKGHPRTPWSAAFHPGITGILASGCLGGHVRVWDYRQGGSEYWDTNCVITSVTFHPKERILFIATLNKLYLWDWLQAVPFTSLSTQSEKEKITFVKFDALGHHLITGITNLKNNNVENGNPFRVYSTASNENSAMTEFEEASWYYRLMMPPHENETRRRIMRPGFYSYMRRRLSASQTLSDLAAAASSQLEAENAAAAAAGTSGNSGGASSSSSTQREQDHDESSQESVSSMRTSSGPPPPPPPPRRSRYTRYPPDHAYIRSEESDPLNFPRRGSSPFTHSPESSFVEVPGSSGEASTSSSSSRPSSYFMEVVYSNPDRSSRFHQRRTRRLRERLSRRQSMYSRVDDIRSSSSDNPLSMPSDRSNFRYRRIDEWAVNRRMSIARLASANANSEESSSNLLSEATSSNNESGESSSTTDTNNGDNPLHLSIRSQVDLSVLGRHIEHMQRICQTSLRYLNVSRQRRQILRLQTIRMMLEDLQNQIRNLRESTLERSDSASNPSTSSSNNALAMSITRRLHLTREGLNRAMRRLNRSTNSTLTSRRTNQGGNSSIPSSYSSQSRYNYNNMSRIILSRLRATVRAMEMSPDLSRSGYNNPVNELMAEESLAVMERTESTSNGDNSSRNALRAMSQRLERIIRENREASNNISNMDSLIPEETSPDNPTPHEGDPPLHEDPSSPLAASEGPQRNWSHLLDHGGYARQPRETSSDSEGDADMLLQRGGDRRHHWRFMNGDQNPDDTNDEEPVDILTLMPSSGFNRRWSSVRSMRELGRASMRERLDSRAEFRRDWEHARQRFSRARMIFHQRREREMGEPSSGSSSFAQGSPQVDNWVLRYLLRRNMQLNALEDEIGENNAAAAAGSSGGDHQPRQSSQQPQQQRPLHREILSWMVDQLTIDQQNGGVRAEPGEPGLPPGSILPPPIPEPIYRRRRAAFYFRHNESGGGGEPPPPPPPPPHNAFPNPRDNYFQQLRNHKYSVTHRLQIWDLNVVSSAGSLPDIGDRTKNIIVEKAKIYNDASVDISTDGNILVTFCSSGLPMNPVVGVYGCSLSNLGICYATYSLESQAVSVSLSPTNRHLLVGVSTKSDRMDITPLDRSLMAQVFKIQYPWDGKSGRGRLIHHRDIHHSPEHGYIGLNSIRWIPNPGQGIVYATNTGLLQILR